MLPKGFNSPEPKRYKIFSGFDEAVVYQIKFVLVMTPKVGKGLQLNQNISIHNSSEELKHS